MKKTVNVEKLSSLLNRIKFKIAMNRDVVQTDMLLDKISTKVNLTEAHSLRVDTRHYHESEKRL
jgi:hypothetical protein